MINNLGSKALETKIDDYMEEYVSDYVSTYMSVSEDQIETNRKVLEAGFEDFVVPVYENAPYTTIQNRAQVTRSLKAVAGVERIHCRGLSRLQNEFGPSGQQVFEADSKDSRIRFIGNWSQVSNVYGPAPITSTLNDYLEITFYGTGLNILVAPDIARDFRASIDGGGEGSNFFPSSISNVLGARNYSVNTVIPVAAGLLLGLHTIKIRLNNASNLAPYGFEILNERTDLAVYSGEGISNGYSNSLTSLATSAFSSGISGLRGARVVKYIQNDVLNTVVQGVNTSAAYLTSADHTNEEVVRRINFREFGANRADDFSTLAGVTSSRAFTLDDGTTTLVANSCNGATSFGLEVIGFPTVGTSSVTITFIGTGLDIIATSVSGFSGTFAVTVDGVAAGNITSFSAGVRNVKIASGLAYGSHTIKLLYSSISGDWTLADFIIYQPKKPIIPSNSFEVADYNVLANFSGAVSATPDAISAGVISKSQAREITYSGTWTAALNITVKNGLTISSSTVGNYLEYTFWGTGFDLVANVGTSGTATLMIDGVNYSGAATATSGSWSQPVWTMSATNGGRLRVSGLALGLHKVRLTITTNVGSLFFHGIDVITPIHINDPSLKVGSSSLKSITKFSPEKSQSNVGPDLSKAKAWLSFNSATNIINGSSNIASVLRLNTGIIRVFFQKPFKTPNYVTIATGSSYDCAVTISNTGVFSPKNNYIDIENFLSDTNVWVDTTFHVAFFGELIDE